MLKIISLRIVQEMEKMKEMENASEHKEPIEMEGVSKYYVPGDTKGEISDEETQRHDTTAQSEVPRRYKRREINIVLDRLAENGPSGFAKLLSYPGRRSLPP
jgi:hypothetical protein